MPQIYEFDLLHADGIRHTDLGAGVKFLNELIFECRRSLEGIEHARLDLEARSWAKASGLGGAGVSGWGRVLLPPVSPARGPPTDWGKIIQAYDDRNGFQPSPVELPVIDIHSL